MPETNPAIPDFNKQTKIVCTGYNGIKAVKVDGDTMTIAPCTNPRNKPVSGPYIIAPSAIGIKAKVIFTGPKVI